MLGIIQKVSVIRTVLFGFMLAFASFSAMAQQVTYQGVQTLNLSPNVSRTMSFSVSTTNFPWVLLVNYGEADAYVKLGNGPATTDDYLVSVGSCFVVATGGSIGLAAIAPAGFSTLRLLQADNEPGCTPGADLNFLARDAHNVSNPTARANLLFTPPSCDGFRSTSGVISSGQLSTLSDPTANFIASDVGKPITLAGVGPTQFIKDVSPSTFAITSLVWAANVITVVGAVPLPVTQVGDVLVISGATNSGTGLNRAINDGFVVATFTDNQHFTLTAPADAGYFGTLAGTPVAVAGGVNHIVDENISLTGGTGTAGKIRVMRVTDGVVTKASGLAHNLGKYTSVPNNPVTAGDATYTLTWNYDNLVTTIAAVIDPNTVTLASPASRDLTNIKWAYGTDYAPQIQAALNDSTDVRLPPGECGVASPLLVSSLHSLKGFGAGGNQQSHTMLVNLGPVDGVVINEDTGAAINGAEISNIGIDSMCSASVGMKLLGWQQGRSDVVSIWNAKDSAFYLSGARDTLADNFFNYYGHWTGNAQSNNCSKNAHAFNMPRSNGLHDTNGVTFMFPNAKTVNGDGFHIAEAFLNSYHLYQHYLADQNNDPGFGIFFGAARTGVSVFTASISGTTMTVTNVASGVLLPNQKLAGAGVTADTSIVGETPAGGGVGTYTVNISQTTPSTTITGSDIETVSARSNVFYHVIAKGDIYAQAGDVRSSERNMILPLELGSSSNFNITVEDGARLLCLNTRGSQDICTSHVYKDVTADGPFSTTATADRRILSVTANPFSPVYAGRATFTVTGQANVSASGRGIQLSFWYADSAVIAPPVNGDTIPAGASRCGGFAGFENAPSATFGTSFTLSCTLSTLARDKSYWFATAGQGSGGAGTFSIKNVHINAHEIP